MLLLGVRAPQASAAEDAPMPPTLGQRVLVGAASQDGSAEDPPAPEPSGAEAGDEESDLFKLDIEQLRRTPVSPTLETEVTTVARTETQVGRSPAAVYVITNEMIKRSGARNVPEALRMAPGVNVARITGGSWAVSIRGFNGQFANKLLVQIDGRAIYVPTFSGVVWEQQHVLLEDVERIEIVRGPGGSVWGANAVNGVINIVTKSAADTQGIYLETGGGSEHKLLAGVRAGGELGPRMHYRLYGTQTEDDTGFSTLGAPWDGYRMSQGGFRVDWKPSCSDTVTLQGDFGRGFRGHRATIPQPAPVALPPLVARDNFDFNTANTLLRWTRELDDDTDWSLQTYYDHWNRELHSNVDYRFSNQDAFDLDYQFHAKLNDFHDVVCGLGYRHYDVAVRFAGRSTFVPDRNTLGIISYFVQDTIALSEDRLFATFGCKFEHNDFTGFEYQPTARLVWTPEERTSIWGSISRTVRTPAIAERDVADLIDGPVAPGPVFARAFGNKGLRAEDALAFEIGMRRQQTDAFYWDLAAFFNRYDNLVGVTPTGLAPGGPPFFLDYTTANSGDGDTYGFELACTYEVNPCWSMRSSYSFLVEQLAYPPDDLPFIVPMGSTPRNQVYLQSGWNLNPCTALDMMFRYTDSLARGVPSYLVMDVRLGWEIRDGIELSVVGQNLLDSQHPEWIRPDGVTEVESGVYGMVSWKH